VSATLTRDPSKLQRLELYQPRFVATVAAPSAARAAADGAADASARSGAAAASGRYSLPRSLSEYRFMVSAARKPLALLALLAEAAGQPTLVFASSLDMTHKCGIRCYCARTRPAGPLVQPLAQPPEAVVLPHSGSARQRRCGFWAGAGAYLAGAPAATAHSRDGSQALRQRQPRAQHRA
jgi:hypothetical protein